ncbi:MAG: hypothetical protein Q7R81_06935 [Candidatus Peregrinibacteria bacterium]|nr:hypothetical protein [Candidatus Peregrinibacteria bacterium]
MLHIISNHFIPVDENTTRMVSDNDIHFTGFMKVVGLFMRGPIKKQTSKYMDNFKLFAETGVPVPRE